MPDQRTRRALARGAFAACAVAFLSLTGPSETTARGQVQQADRVAVGDSAADFTLESIDGETFRLADLRGDKDLVLIFFRGTW